MRFLGIDYGEKRIGLAYGDELGMAFPLPAAVEPRKAERFRHLEGVIMERRIDALVVGYPVNMDGSVGFKAKEVDAFIAELEKCFRLPVQRIDERLTSVEAESRGREAARTATRATGEVDSRAAAILLQDYLDSQGVGALEPPPDEGP